MKKSLLLVVLLFSLSFFLFSCVINDNSEILTAKYNEYKIDLAISDDLKTIDLAETILVTNNSSETWNEIVINSYANAYREFATNRAYFSGLNSYGGLDIFSIKVNNTDADYTELSNMTSTSIKINSVKPTESLTIDLTGRYLVPECNLRFGLDDEILNFADVIPTVACFENGSWRADNYSRIGDPYFNDLAKYTVNIASPFNLKIASSGVNSNRSGGADNQSLVTITGDNIRSFGFSASHTFAITSGSTSSGIQLNYYGKNGTKHDKHISVAFTALNTFSNLIGNLETKCVSIVENTIYYDKSVSSNLIFVKSSLSEEAKTDKIVFAIANLWFGESVGCDMVKTPWISESICAYLVDYYYLKTIGKSEFDSRRSSVDKTYADYVKNKTADNANYDLSINRTVYKFSSIHDYTMILHSKGSIMFDTLFKSTGAVKFERILKNYFESNKYKFATLDSLLKALQDVSEPTNIITSGIE
ncbi:MAG: hypothetical protein LBF12_02065 [Christensenellaceae bacterium]|jgi:hypothetical protein|nr:hypothetical protein [Christensenellaceae bacterium]